MGQVHHTTSYCQLLSSGRGGCCKRTRQLVQTPPPPTAPLRFGYAPPNGEELKPPHPSIDLEPQCPTIEQQPKKYPYHPRRGLPREPIGCFAKGQTDRLDYDANQGEVSGHADHGAYQNSKPTSPPPPLEGRS